MSGFEVFAMMIFLLIPVPALAGISEDGSHSRGFMPVQRCESSCSDMLVKQLSNFSSV